MADFVTYLWGTPKIDDLEGRAAALAAADFTVVDWQAGALDVLSGSGLKGMVHKPAVETVRQVAGHPALWGYHCGDEPYPEEEFAAVARKFQMLHEVDPHHPAFLNMLSTAGPFLRTYMEVTQPDILSFDYYQWWWGSDRYFEKLPSHLENPVLSVSTFPKTKVSETIEAELSGRSGLPQVSRNLVRKFVELWSSQSL